MVRKSNKTKQYNKYASNHSREVPMLFLSHFITGRGYTKKQQGQDYVTIGKIKTINPWFSPSPSTSLEKIYVKSKFSELRNFPLKYMLQKKFRATVQSRKPILKTSVPYGPL